jgi:hypothetical protein
MSISAQSLGDGKGYEQIGDLQRDLAARTLAGLALKSMSGRSMSAVGTVASPDSSLPGCPRQRLPGDGR